MPSTRDQFFYLYLPRDDETHSLPNDIGEQSQHTLALTPLQTHSTSEAQTASAIHHRPMSQQSSTTSSLSFSKRPVGPFGNQPTGLSKLRRGPTFEYGSSTSAPFAAPVQGLVTRGTWPTTSLPGNSAGAGNKMLASYENDPGLLGMQQLSKHLALPVALRPSILPGSSGILTAPDNGSSAGERNTSSHRPSFATSGLPGTPRPSSARMVAASPAGNKNVAGHQQPSPSRAIGQSKARGGRASPALSSYASSDGSSVGSLSSSQKARWQAKFGGQLNFEQYCS